MVSVAGVLDSNMTVGERVFNVPVMGGDDLLDTLAPSAVLLLNGLGANPNTRLRARLFDDLKARRFEFAVLRHPSVVMGVGCHVGQGVQMMAGVVLQPRVHVGENAVINTNVSVDHDCAIGTHAFVSPGVVLSGHVSIAESAFVGVGAVLLPHVSIGEHAVVGGGGVVTENVPAGWIVVGNPAVKVGINE
jgi:UDP-perosamine 4-acetyltransferase